MNTKNTSSLPDGLAPRMVAFRALMAWQQGNGYLQDQLQSMLGSLEERDRGLAYELAMGVCRNHRRLQNAVRTFAKERKPDLTLETCLCLGLYQIFHLERVPQHAAVHVTVELARRVNGEASSRFANAMLHHAIKDGLPTLSSDPVQAMGMEFSVQDWLVAKWLRQANGDKLLVRQKLEQARQVPHQWVRVHTAKISLADFKTRFELTDARVWGNRFVEVDSKLGGMLASVEFAQGKFSVQNPASDLLVRLLEVPANASVWDACAAPGGKSALILESVPTAKLVASDIDEKRLASMDDLTKRLQLPTFETIVCDASAPNHGRRFDRILLDSPCSNLGVMSRRPEVPMRLDRKSFEQTCAKQKRILQASAQCLEVGGILVYATCSPEPEETVQVVQEFLQKNPNFILEDAASLVDARFVKDSFVQAFDAEMGFDGFFGARVKRLS